MLSETASADSRGRRCPLSSCADVGEEETPQGRLVSAAGGLGGAPWFTERVVEVRRPEVEERVFEVPQVVRREKVVEEPRQVIKERLKYIPKFETVERVTHVPKRVTKEIVTDVPQVQVVERTVEVPTTVYQDVVIPVPKPVIEERTTEVPKPVFVEKVVEVPRVVHRPCPVDRVVEVPQTRVEYRYRDVPVPRKVVRSVVAPPVHQKQQLPAATIRWKEEIASPNTPINCCAFSPRGLLAACCPVSLPRAATHKTRIYADAERSSSNHTKYHLSPSPARFYTAPISNVAVPGKGDEAAGPSPQPFVVEGIEPAADAAACCTLSPRRHKVKRSELLLAPRGRTGKPIHVRVATLSPRRRAGALGATSSPRAASVPPTMTLTAPPPPFHPVPVPVYQYQQQLFEEQPEQQETQMQQEQQQAVLEPAEPWIRTKLGDMPFAEFERLNNANSLVSSPRPTPAFSTVTFAAEGPPLVSHRELFQQQQQYAFEQQQQHIAYEQQQQQQQALAEKQRLAQEEAERFHQAEQQHQRLLASQQQQQQAEEARRQQQQREEEARRLLLQQQQREEEARRAYEQQEQQRLEQLRLMEQQRREAEARRQEELQQLQQQLQRQREQQERELQQRREEAQRRQEEERQKLMTRMQQEREQMEQVQRERQRKEVEQLLQMQESQLREHEERQQRFIQEHEQVLANLLQQQQQQQQQLQTELKEHQQRLQEQQQLLRVQQQQALRQLQDTHARQQQKLLEEAQRKAEACWLEEDPSFTKQQQPVYLPVNGSGDAMIDTRFGLLPYRFFLALNEANTFKSVSPVPPAQTHGYTRGVDSAKNGVYMHARPGPAVQRVVYSNPTPNYIPVTTKQQYYYVQPPPTTTAWAPEASNQWLLPSGEEAESLKSVAQRIGQEAAAAGSQVYGGVKTAMNSEVTQGLFRSVGELVTDAYNRIKQSRQ
ncbi:hypothetical protein ACSSS7_001786 [Eimeria intestinalis]